MLSKVLGLHERQVVPFSALYRHLEESFSTVVHPSLHGSDRRARRVEPGPYLGDNLLCQEQRTQQVGVVDSCQNRRMFFIADRRVRVSQVERSEREMHSEDSLKRFLGCEICARIATAEQN